MVDVADATLALKSAIGLAALSPAQDAVADVDGDGRFDLRDVTLILQAAIGL